MGNWTPTDVQNTIAALSGLFNSWSGLLTALAAVFAGVAVYRTGKNKTAIAATNSAVDKVAATTDNHDAQLTELSEKVGEAKGIAATLSAQQGAQTPTDTPQ